ncbi:MAG: YjgP/YjgQ family permease [Verrucomicrobia bacterium]|nr:YjgP/YjgQ family permease [Verrucomicrobiota bacterium]
MDAEVRLLDRHVLTETAVAGGAATGAFVFVMVAGNILTQVSSAIASGRVSGWEGLELVGLLFPGVLPYALPLGLLTGVLIAFGRMSSQQELTAMKASGRSLGRIARPALLLAGALALLSAWLNLEVAPYANTEYRRLLVGSAKDNPASVIVPGKLNRQFPGMVIRAAERDGEVLRDFWLWSADEQGRLTQTIHAREARLAPAVNAKGEGILRITLTDARLEKRQAGDENFDRPSSFTTAGTTQLEFPASGIFKDGENFQRKLRWLTTSELLVAMDKGWQVAPNATRKEKERGQMLATTQLMAHLAGALSVFSLAFLAVPLAVRVGRSETFVNAAVALGVALSYYLLTSMAAYVKDPDLRPDLLIWLPNVVVVGVAWSLLRRASRH